MTWRRELEFLKGRPSALSDYIEGIAKIYSSGVFSLLRTFGRVDLGVGKETMEQAALKGAHAAGFQDCLDLLLNFKEVFIDPKPTQANIVADYGGLRAAVARGDLTEDEANAIRANSKFSVKPTK